MKSMSGKSIPLAAISVQNNTPLERERNFLYNRALFLGTIFPWKPNVLIQLGRWELLTLLLLLLLLVTSIFPPSSPAMLVTDVTSLFGAVGILVIFE